MRALGLISVRTALLTCLALALAPSFALADGKDDKPRKEAPKDIKTTGKRIVQDQVVAIVNDAIIMRTELEVRLLPVIGEANQIADPTERARRISKLRSQVLDEMINEELIVQAAESAKVDVDSSEVQAAIDEIKSQNNLDDAGLASALAAQGFTVNSYKADLRRQLLRMRAVNQLVAPKVTITEEDIKAKYDQQQRRADSVTAVKLSHILFKLPEHPTEQQLADAKERAAKAMERIKGGEEFGKVAGEISEDDGTKASGGELGWFQRGSTEWDAVVFSADKGEVRGPVVGSQGMHVFLITDVKKTEIKPYADMKEQLSREIRRREMDKQTQTWLEELRKKAYIDIKLT